MSKKNKVKVIAKDQGTSPDNLIKGTELERFTRYGTWNRDLPWENGKLERDEGEIFTGEEVLNRAGLNWDVIPKPVYVGNCLVKNRKGLVREVELEDGRIEESVLGIVSNNGYTIMQNREAFDYLDSLVGTELQYTAAGQIRGGRQVYMVAETKEDWKIGDDPIGGNLLLSNGHDGLHTLQIAITPIRIFCKNCLNVAFKEARRTWSIKHRMNFQEKIQEARRALDLTGIYMENLRVWGEQLIDKKVTDAQVEYFINELFPKPENESKRGKTVREKRIADFWDCMNAPDIQPYYGTAWQFVNAASDYETHRKQEPDALMNRVINDSLPLWHRATQLAAVA